jgi:hypothetical protein
MGEGQDYFGNLHSESSGLAMNFQTLIEIDTAESQQINHGRHGKSIPHLGNWKLERGIKDATQAQCAGMEGNFIRFLGLTLARKEVKLKKRRWL